MSNDAVSRVENHVTNAMGRVEKLLNERLDQLVPKGFGQDKVAKTDELREYIATIAQAPDPVAASTQWIQDAAKQWGLPRAQTMFAQYVSRNETAMQKLVESHGSETSTASMPPQITPSPSSASESTNY